MIEYTSDNRYEIVPAWGKKTTRHNWYELVPAYEANGANSDRQQQQCYGLRRCYHVRPGIKLKENNLFLPLDGNPDKRVFSYVRSTERGFVPAFSLGTFLTGNQGINKESMEFVENIRTERRGA